MYNIHWVKQMENLKKILLFGFIFDVILILIIIKLPYFYVGTVLFSCITNIITMVCDVVRTKKLGFVVRKENIGDDLHFLIELSTLIPLFNVLFSQIFFCKIVCSDDEKFIDFNKSRFIPFKQGIKEYKEENIDLLSNSKKVSEVNEISKEEYNTAVKFMEIENYIDEIRMNVNLNNKQKEQLLKQMKRQILIFDDVRISNNKIKKLSKIPK